MNLRSPAYMYFFLLGLKTKREEERMKKAKEHDSKQTTPLKYDVRMDTTTSAPQTNTFTQNAEKSGQLLTTSYESKTPPMQSSPRGGTRNPSPSIALHKQVEMTPTSVSDENPSSVPPPSVPPPSVPPPSVPPPSVPPPSVAPPSVAPPSVPPPSVPPPSVLPAPSPHAPSSGASPQRPSVTATLANVSPPTTTGVPPVTRIPSQTGGVTPALTRVSFSGTLPSQTTPIPTSNTHQNMQQLPSRSFAPSGSQVTSQIGGSSQASSQSAVLGSVVSHLPSSNPLSQGAASLAPSLNRTVTSTTVAPLSSQIPSSMAQGFPNVVATGTSLPSTTNPSLYSSGASHTPAVSLGSQTVSAASQTRQPVGSMAAAVAAAESAVLQANAQILPSQRVSMVQSGQMPSGIGISGQTGGGAGQVMPTSVTHNIPTPQGMNLGMSTGISQPSTSVTQTMIPSSLSTGQQQNVPGTQPGMPQAMPGQQRPLLNVQHATTQQGVSTGQSMMPPQFGIPGSQPSRAMQQGTVQSQAPTGLQPNMPRGQQPLAAHQGHKGPQPSLSNPGMPPNQQTHMQQPAQGMPPGMVGTASTLPNTHQMGGVPQALQTSAQPQGIPPNPQMHPGQPGAFAGQLPQQVRDHLRTCTLYVYSKNAWRSTCTYLYMYMHSMII